MLTRLTFILLSLTLPLAQRAATLDPKYEPIPIELGEPDGEYLGYQYVDLGLESGNLWAIHNLGAEVPEGVGLYFAWGEVEPKEYYTLENYEFYLGDAFYPGEGHYHLYEDIGQEIGGSQYDAATHHWGEGWRTPSFDDFYELWVYCKEEARVALNGMNGAKITGFNGHELFIPCSGRGGTSPGESIGINLSGVYWLSTDTPYPFPYLPVRQRAYYFLLFDSHGLFGGVTEKNDKYKGFGIRPVTNKSVTALSSPTTGTGVASISFHNGQITIAGPEGEYQMTISDLSGRNIYSANVGTGSCSLPSLSKGIYLVSLRNGRAVIATKKIAVK